MNYIDCYRVQENNLSLLVKFRHWPILILLLLGLSCAACSGQASRATVNNDGITEYSSISNDLVSNYLASFSDNDITVYSSLPSDVVNGYLATFRAEHPEVNVRLVNGVTLTLIERLLAEEDDPQADVVWGLAVSSMLTLEWNYLLTMYAPTGLERLDPLFVDSRQPPQWVGISARSIALCVNQEELRKRNLPIPTSWQDLVNPIYQGQLVILNPGGTSVGYLLISTILQRYGGVDGWDYLAQLHENVAGQYANNARGVCQLVLNGNYPIGLTYDYRAHFPDEPTMMLVFPLEGVGWDMEVNGLIRKEHIKSGAKIFLDWAISDSAMKRYAKDRLILATATDPETEQSINDQGVSAYLFDMDIAWVAANRDRVQEEWMELYGDDSELIDTSR